MDNQNDTILEARSLYKSFESGGRSLEVLNGVNIDIARGELVAVMGASGVGKSTLLHILGTLEEPTSGQLDIVGKNVSEMSIEMQARFRNEHIGFVFQHHC